MDNRGREGLSGRCGNASSSMVSVLGSFREELPGRPHPSLGRHELLARVLEKTVLWVSCYRLGVALDIS
eukprot:9493336-Pyramimonas_sp.AAC.1